MGNKLQQVLVRKTVQKTKVEAAKMILDRWNQQETCNLKESMILWQLQVQEF